MALSYIAKKGCFDNLSHQHIMDCLEGFPAKETISKWLNAGYIDNGSFNDTYSGTPQGGLCKASHNPPYAKYSIMQSKLNKPFKYGIRLSFTLHNI